MAYAAYRLVFPTRSFFPCFSPTFLFSKQRTMLNKLIDKAKRPLSPRSPRKESNHSAEDEHLSVGLPPTPRGSEEAVSKNNHNRSIAESPPKGKIDWVNTYDVYVFTCTMHVVYVQYCHPHYHQSHLPQLDHHHHPPHPTVQHPQPLPPLPTKSLIFVSVWYVV